jgi:hypothetical protein
MPTPEPQDTSLVAVFHLDQAGPEDAPGQARQRDTPAGPAPVNIEVDLEPGTTIHIEPDPGMPFVVIDSGRVHINLGLNAGHASELTDEHLALVDQLADAFQSLRDQIRSAATAAASPGAATAPDTPAS